MDRDCGEERWPGVIGYTERERRQALGLVAARRPFFAVDGGAQIYAATHDRQTTDPCAAAVVATVSWALYAETVGCSELWRAPFALDLPPARARLLALLDAVPPPDRLRGVASALRAVLQASWTAEEQHPQESPWWRLGAAMAGEFNYAAVDAAVGTCRWILAYRGEIAWSWADSAARIDTPVAA